MNHRRRFQMPHGAPMPGQRRSPGHYWHHPYHWYWDDWYWDNWYWDEHRPYWDDDYDYYRGKEQAKPRKSQFIKVDPILLVNLFEYARTQATSDRELQDMVDRMMTLSMNSWCDVLDLAEYDAITGKISKPEPSSKSGE